MKKILTLLLLLVSLVKQSNSTECDEEGYITLPNKTCQFIDDVIGDDSFDKCENYCQNGGECKVVEGIPQCECKDNFYGLNCKVNNENLKQHIEGLTSSISKNENTPLYEDDKPIFGRILSLTTIIVQNPTEIYKTVDTSIINSIDEKVRSTVKYYQTSRAGKPPRGIFSFVNLSLLLHLNYLTNQSNKTLRQLDSSSQPNITQAIEYAKQLSKINVKNIEPTSSYIESTDITGSIVYQSWRNTPEGNRLYKLACKRRSLTYADFSSLSDSNLNTQVNFDVKFASVLENKNSNFGYPMSLKSNLIQVINLPSLYVTLPLMDDDHFNVELYKYYNDRGIDIYNHNDKAFTDSCYKNKKLPYDLTQKYRKKNLFQKFTFAAPGCFYQSYDAELNGVKFLCESSYIPDYYIMKDVELKGNLNHVDNLPTKCADDVENIEENIAFWLFLILFIVIIIFDILFAVLSCKKIIKEDQAIQSEFDQIKTTERTVTNATNANQVKIEVPSFASSFTANFKKLHPLFSLCNSSMIFTSWVLLYNILCLFGFNALYFNETMLEDRIYDKHRDNFGYPMKTEFEKIMSAIATTIALTVVARAIALVPYGQKEKSTKGVVIRRIISGVFMLVLEVFFFYYCIVFCGIYLNAQYGWFYSGIWALLWDWIAFAPIYIIVISIVEVNGGEKCGYYMKELFAF